MEGDAIGLKRGLVADGVWVLVRHLNMSLEIELVLKVGGAAGPHRHLTVMGPFGCLLIWLF